MIVASWLLFFVMLWWVLGREAFIRKWKTIFLLSILVVVVGMLFGKYGAAAGLPWWIFYPIPMLMTVLLPPIVLKLNRGKTILYLLLSFLSAPLIHVFFSFFFNWTEYMPFWKLPHIGQ